MVIECAAEAVANVLASGGKDLLEIGSYRGIRILTSRIFLDEFSFEV